MFCNSIIDGNQLHIPSPPTSATSIRSHTQFQPHPVSSILEFNPLQLSRTPAPPKFETRRQYARLQLLIGPNNPHLHRLLLVYVPQVPAIEREGPIVQGFQILLVAVKSQIPVVVCNDGVEDIRV